MSAPPLGERARSTLARLARAGWGLVEVHEKRGRSRRYELGPEGESVAGAEEAGWAVRAGDADRSVFAAGTGAPEPELALPEPTPHPLRLPEARPVPAWSEPPGLAAPLLSESEAWALLAAIAEEAARELPGARLVAARLEDGASEGFVASSRGVAALARARAATLRIELEAAGERCVVEAAERDPRAFAAPALAALCAAGGRIASERVTLVDDGRRAEGALAAPVDGEGLPTGERRLIERGELVGPLLAWWEAKGETLPGCARRAGWRDLPRRAPTQMLILPDPALAPGELIAGVAAGACLIDAEGGVRWEPGALRFSVVVSGYALAGGRAVAPLGLCRLEGELRALLGGVAAVARDLAFASGDGLYGSPSLLVRGLRLRSL